MNRETSDVVQSGFWLYISQLSYTIGGFIYWYLISLISGAHTVGIVSSILGASNIVTSIRSLGTNTSTQKFLGQYIKQKKTDIFSSYLWTTITYNLASSLLAAIIIVAAAFYGLKIPGFEEEMIVFVSLLVFLNISLTFNSILRSLLETKFIAIGSIFQNIFRLTIGVFLVLLGLQWTGAAIGLLSGLIVTDIIFIVAIRRVLLKRNITVKPYFDLNKLYDLIKAGVVSWIPAMLLTVGQWLGLLVINADIGSRESGYYYIAYSIYNVVQMLPATYVMLMMPVLSGMGDGRKTTAWNITRISLALAGILYPLLVFYSSIPLSLIGEGYVEASFQLSILALSIIPMVMVASVQSLAYAYGLYREILYIGLGLNVPRLLLYFALIKNLGSDGIAIAYTIGSLFGLAAAFIVSRRIGFRWSIISLFLSLGVGLLVTMTLRILISEWMLSAAFSLMLSVILFVKLKLISIEELREVVSSVFLKKE